MDAYFPQYSPFIFCYFLIAILFVFLYSMKISHLFMEQLFISAKNNFVIYRISFIYFIRYKNVNAYSLIVILLHFNLRLKPGSLNF